MEKDKDKHDRLIHLFKNNNKKEKMSEGKGEENGKKLPSLTLYFSLEIMN